MLEELCHETKNWFAHEKFYGDFTIKDGVISSHKNGNMGLQNGQYFRIVGSVFNDGVYQYGDEITDLTNEEFVGSVWAMAIPKEFLRLAEKIKEWCDKYDDVGSAAMSPFTSESFGGYSYSKAGGGAADGSTSAGTWQSVFSQNLNKWRKI